MRGRVQALISLGAGFNPILTGRENIYINASVLGIPKREIDRRLDEIIDFAEIGDFIGAPVRSYSSGMKVRLGFSIAMALQPDIMLIDEVLAVGDLAFHNKCTRAIERIKNSGVAFIFVSHNIGWVNRLSDKVVYLKKGKIKHLGDSTDAILSYVTDSPESTNKFIHLDGSERYIALLEVHFLDESGFPVDTIMSGQSLRIRFVFDVRQHLQEPRFHVLFLPFGQEVVAACMNQQENGPLSSLFPGRHVLDVNIPSFPLLGGKYSLKLAVTGSTTLIKYARIDNIGSVIVTPRSDQLYTTNRGGFVEISSTWKIV